MTTSELPMLPWNLVAKNLHPHEQLRKKLRQKISKLEKHLHFPAGTVHLHLALEKHPKKPLFTAALTLRLPSNILRSEKQAADPIPAFERAVKALLRELAGLKSEQRLFVLSVFALATGCANLADLRSELRREAVWKRPSAAPRYTKPRQRALPNNRCPQSIGVPSPCVSLLLLDFGCGTTPRPPSGQALPR